MDRRTVRLLTPALLVGAVACGGARPPRDQMTTANQAIRHAQENDAAELAPAELGGARDKYEAARRAMDAADYDAARRLAEEANVDAEYAETKARTERARKAAEETRESIEALRREAERNAIE